MLISTLVTALAAALPAPSAVGIIFDEIGELSREDATLLVDEIARSIGRVSGREALWIESPAFPCRDAMTRCVERERAGLWLHVRAFAGLRLLRLEVEREAPERPRVSLDLPRDPELWPAPLEAMARQLVPKLTSSDASAVVAPAAPEREPRRLLLPVSLLAAGAIAGAVAIGFGVSSLDARNHASSPLSVDLELVYRREADRAQAHAIVADISWAVAGAATLGGALWLWLEEGT